LKLKTAIIGTGKVADIHASALINIKESEFTAVYSRTFSRAEVFAAKYGVTAYSDLENMIQRAGIEAAVIGTPHPAHATPAIKLMKAGIHVIIEKPLASSLEDCDSMINAAQESGVKLAMISQRRLY